MKTTPTTLGDVLAAVVVLSAKIDTLFKRLDADESGETAQRAPDSEVTLAELVPLMPPGLRSRSSVNRLLRSGAITGRKVRGTWSFKPAKVLADLDHFERASSVASLMNPKVNRKKVPRT